ncbi:MAG: Fic family protein [Bordetella sp.]|uniref:Fic family protein n=1 Tax=Bordetella sp. TaxID=28081 RepID=UPI003F7C4674
MRKSDLAPPLQATCVPVPGKSGCFAVVPPPAVPSVDVPSSHALMMLARRELEILGGVIARNPAHADLLFHMLNRREAVDSSQIEGTHTSFDGLLIHEIQDGTEDAQPDADADMTLNYVRAFAHGAACVQKEGQSALRLPLIQSLHELLMQGDDKARPGQWRLTQNWIGGIRIETAGYIPPPPELVPALMADLEGLLQWEPDGPQIVSILMRAAIAHVQFEAIHPFMDGNGRTGRLLLPLMFKADGEPPIHLATFLKVRKQEYYRALEQVQKHLNWAPWLRLFLECVIASCRHTVKLFGDLQALQTQWHAAVSNVAKRRDATIWKVIALLLGQPVISVNMIAQRLDITFPAANTAIGQLVNLGILRQVNEEQRRNRIFHAHEVMNALYTGLDDVIQEVENQTREV